MAKKVSKNQRPGSRGGESRDMARVVLAQKKSNGKYSFRSKMVPAERVQEEIKAARS